MADGAVVPAEAATTAESGKKAMVAQGGGPSRITMDEERRANNFHTDSPPCPDCGSVTVRNGACYKCNNCGATTGCS